MAPPSDLALAEILGPSTRVTRRCDIYENDATTLWMSDAPVLDGSVTVSNSRAERRTFSLSLDNEDGSLISAPHGFWYDKVVKLYRGVETEDGRWETQIGEFLIDDISEPHFPDIVEVSGRDYAKRLLKSKFLEATTFAAGLAPESVISTIATNGGVTKQIVPATGLTLAAPLTFEGGTERWKAISDIAIAYSFEVFFDASGYLVMQETADPVTTPEVWTFETGDFGNLASFGLSANDSEIHNVVVVTGENSSTSPLVFGVARNTAPDSPTRIATPGVPGGLEERVQIYTSPSVTTTAQAEALAWTYLKIAALESYELSLSSIALPWLDVGSVVRFVDPDHDGSDPERFLLTDFTIPLGLGPMSATAKRISIVSAPAGGSAFWVSG